VSQVSLTVGLGCTPYTQALFDGSVRPSGVELHLESRFGAGLDNVGARHRMIVAGKLDGGELSISSFILARLRGVPLRALPVFLSRLPGLENAQPRSPRLAPWSTGFRPSGAVSPLRPRRLVQHRRHAEERRSEERRVGKECKYRWVAET